MSQPHHHVFNALQREIYRGVPIEQLLPILLSKGVVKQESAHLYSSKNGIKVLVGYLRKKDFGMFMKFVECICLAHETPTGGSKVEKPIVAAIRSVVNDFDKRNETNYVAEVDRVISNFQKMSLLDVPSEATGETREEMQEVGEGGASAGVPSKHLGLPLVNEPMTIMFSSDGGVKEIEEFDISLYAPPGVVQRDQNLILNIGLCFYGPFSIPDKYLVATGFYYITANTRLRKGLEITMGHCLQMAVYERSNQVVVLRADHQTVSGSDRYVFEPLTHPDISQSSPYLSFTIDNFCILCGALDTKVEGSDSEEADSIQSENTLRKRKLHVSDHSERKRRCKACLEYCILLFEPREKESTYSVIVYFCQYCPKVIKVCKQQASEYFMDKGATACDPVSLQVTFEKSSHIKMCTQLTPKKDAIYVSSRKTPVINESHIQLHHDYYSTEQLQGLTNQRIYPPSIEYVIHIGAPLQTFHECTFFFDGASCSDCTSEKAFIKITLPHTVFQQHRRQKNFKHAEYYYLNKLSSARKKKVEDRSLAIVADNMTSHWKSVGELLEISETQMNDIEFKDCKNSERTYQVLYQWKMESSVTTNEDLLRALSKIEEIRAIDKLVENLNCNN